MMPLSPSENKPNDGDNLLKTARREAAPPPILSKLRDEVPMKKSNLVDRFQSAAVNQVNENKNDGDSAYSLPPMETPFKPLPSSRRTSAIVVPNESSFQTPAHLTKIQMTDAPSSVRNVETLQAEIRRLHEQKLELIDKLADSDANASASKVSNPKLDMQLRSLQSQLMSKEDLLKSLSKEKDDLISQIAELQTEHFTETARLKMQIEELCSQNVQNYGRRSVDKRPQIILDRSIETPHHRLSVLHGFEEERDVLRKRLEDTQDQLANVMSESKDIRARLERDLSIFKEQLQQSRKKELELEEGNELLKARLEQEKVKQSGAFEATVSRLRRELENYEQQLQQAKDQVESLRRQKLYEKTCDEAKIRELQSKVEQKEMDISQLNFRIESLSAQLSENSGRPSTSLIESVSSRLEQSIQTISQLQSAYSNLRKSYHELREAKKLEESFFSAKIEDLRNSVSPSADSSKVSQAEYDRMLVENSRLSSKLEQYKAHMQDLNNRFVDGMGNMDRLQEALSTVSNLQEDIKSMSESYEQKLADMNHLVDQLKTENKTLKSRQSMSKTSSSQVDIPSLDRDLIVDSLERDKLVMERQLSEMCNSAYVGDFSDRNDSLAKRLRRLKSSFEVLNATSALNDVCELEQKFKCTTY